MRPIDKGDVPQIEGNVKVVSDYKDWRQDLIDRLGNYCCYCNLVLNDSPQVEHVIPKSTTPHLRLEWSNMLLACGPCNRAKSDLDYTDTNHYLPDVHNTHLAFEYIVIPHPTKKNTNACIPAPSNFQGINIKKAEDTIELFKMTNVISNARATDLRWKYRYEAVVNATIWRKEWDDWGKTNENGFIRLLLTAATAKGFFSIWYSFFQDEPQIKSALLTAFIGTNKKAFDISGNAISLINGDL